MMLEESKAEMCAASSELATSPSEIEIKSSLLAAVGKPTRPYQKGEFVELARRIVAEERSAS